MLSPQQSWVIGNTSLGWYELPYSFVETMKKAIYWNYKLTEKEKSDIVISEAIKMAIVPHPMEELV